MLTKNENGFTLIEVVVSVALISILALGFYQIIMTSSGIYQRTASYNEATYAFKAYSVGIRDRSGSTELYGIVEENESVSVPIAGGESIELTKTRLEYGGGADADKRKTGYFEYFSLP